MAHLEKFWKEEQTTVPCPRCGEKLFQQFPCDEHATTTRPVPGIVYSAKPDCILCKKCTFRMILGKKKPYARRLTTNKFRPPDPIQ